MNKLRKIFALTTIAATASLFAMSPASAQLKRIGIGTNKAGTMYFVLGGGFAKLFQEKLSIKSNAQPHAGSSAYIPLLDQGEITMGLNSSLDLARAYNGMEPYPRAMKGVRALARIWVLPYSYVVRAKSGIRTVEDLRDKKVVVSFKANVGMASLNRAIMETGGLTKDQYQDVVVAGLGQGINAVVEGRADASPAALGIPLLRKANAGVPGGIRIVELGKLANDAFLSERAGGAITKTTKPSKRNVGVESDMTVAAFDTFVNVSAKLSSDDAYRLIKTMHENWADLQKDYPVLRGVSPSQLAPNTNPHPYHDGAIRFYKEAGLWTEAHEKHQSKLLQ